MLLIHDAIILMHLLHSSVMLSIKLQAYSAHWHYSHDVHLRRTDRHPFNGLFFQDNEARDGGMASAGPCAVICTSLQTDIKCSGIKGSMYKVMSHLFVEAARIL